jgi:hypothetical protein
MSMKLTDNEVTSFILEANDYVSLSVPYNTILPIKRIKDGYTHTWYVSTEIDGPESSKDGRAPYDVRTARDPSSANIQSFVYTFEIPRVEVTMAQQAGVPIWSENTGNAMRKLNDALLLLQIRGSQIWDNVSITGMITGGTDVNAALDDDKWDTVTKPIDFHLKEGYGDLNTAGYSGPFTWLMSSNLEPGLIKKYGAGDPSQKTMVGDYKVNEMIFLPSTETSGTANTRTALKPMGAPGGDEGTWLLYQKDPNYAYYAEVFPPTVTLDPNLDFRRQSYHGRIEARGTVAIVQSTSISYENEVDLV